MANEISDRVPGQVNMGETLKFRVSFSDYKPSDGWALVFKFASEVYWESWASQPETAIDVRQVEAVADGDAWVVTQANVNLQPGTGRWQLWASKDGESYVIDSGTFEIINTMDRNTLGSQAERDLIAVRRALVPTTSVGVQEYEIGGVGSNRRLRNYTREDLLRLEESLAQRVNAEKRRAAQAKGAPYFKTIYPR
jgi:hypothetical protein